MTGILPNSIEQWLGIQPGAGEGTVWNFEHSWHWPPWLSLLAAIFAIAFVVGIYWREGTSITRRYRLMLAVVRLLLLGIVALMIAQISISLKRTGLPSVAVILDDSQSMTVADRYDEPLAKALQERMKKAGLEEAEINRFRLAQTVLLERNAAMLGHLGDSYKLRTFFLTGSKPTQAVDVKGIAEEIRKAKPSGESTRLGSGVRDVLDELRGSVPAAIVLLTDGVNTDGPSLAEGAASAQRRGVPMFCVGIGSEQPVRDLKLTDFLVEDVVFVGDVVPFECKLTGTGFQGTKVNVVLREKDKPEPLAKAEVTVGPDDQPQPVRILYRPTETGRFEFVVEVEPQSGEVQTDNNRQSHAVEVRKEKIRVLLAEAYPNFEYRYLRNMLERDETIELNTVLQEADMEHAEQDKAALRVFPERKEELFAYDVIILGDVNPALLSPAAQQCLADFVDQPGKGGALVFIAGPQSMPLGFRNTPLAKLMPFDLNTVRLPDPNAPLTEGFQVQPTDLGLALPPMQLGDTPEETKAIWEHLPPLYWLMEAPELKPAARVLAEDSSRTRADGRKMPVIVMQYVGAGKVLFHATDETWRWRYRVGDVYFARYWIQMIRYLSRSKLAEGGQNAVLSTDRREYAPGEPVRLRVRFADERLAPAEDDGVQIVVEQAGRQTQKIALRRTSGRGTFEGVMSRPTPGSYHAWMAIPHVEGTAPAADFTVAPPAGEFAQIRMDAQALREAAAATGGKYYTVETASKLLDDLPPGRQVPLETLPPIPLWNRWPVLLMFLVLIIAEWVMRKDAEWCRITIMSHPLEERLAELRHRVRRLLAVYGATTLLAGVLGGLIVFGWLDYLVRFEDRGLRIMASLAFLAAVGWTAYRHFYLPRQKPLGDGDLAMKIERRFPNLEDRLASSVDFLGQEENDPTAGSPVLRRAVIAQTIAATENLDFNAVLDSRPAMRASYAAATAFLLAVILIVLDPGVSGTAVARLLNPFGNSSWPRKNHLMIREPVEKLARGGAFEVQVADAEDAALPGEMRIIYKFSTPDGTATEENAVLRASGKTAVIRRENVLKPFSYRVEGGDDRSMQPMNVEVVEPPAVETIAAKLFPPVYTGWPMEKSEGNIRALAGTRIEIHAKANKPLASAKLVLESGEEFIGKLSGDGLQMTFDDPELVVSVTDGYRFELHDREGLNGGRDDRYEIRAVPDAPPSVAVEQPAGNLYVTPVAAAPLRISAKDDLAVRQIAVKYHRVDEKANGEKPSDAESAFAVYSGPEKMLPQSQSKPSGGDRQTVEYRWELEPLQLASGMQLEFYAEASDYLPQTGRSDVRRLFVVTPRELQDRLAARQSLLAAELLRALTMQQGGREQIEAMIIRLQEVKRFEQPDLDRLRAAEINQRQVDNLLTSDGEGVPMHVRAILTDLENNRLDTPDLVRRMQDILDELDRIGREHLPVIGREMTSAIKTAEITLTNSPQASEEGQGVKASLDSLSATAKQQDQVIAALEKLLSQLKQAEGYQRFHRDLSLLLRDEEETARRTGDVGKRTLSKLLADLPPQDVADLRILATRQLEHARTLDRILQAMQDATEQLRRDDPVAADLVADALEEARRLAIGNSMRVSGENLRQNQIGQAAALQKEIVRQIQEVLDILANRRNQELDRLVKKLREAAADLDDLAARQAEVHQAMDKNAENPPDAQTKKQWDKLAEEQERLRKEAEKLARRLERLTAERAAASAKKAAGEMGAAGQAAAAGNGAGAGQGAGAAEKSLAEAKRQLAERQREAELELATEQLSRMEDAVKQLHAQQQKACEETDRLEQLRRKDGEFSRSQLATLRDVARMQRSLEEDARKLAEKLTASGAFNLTLNGAASDMGRAADLLDRRTTAAETHRAQQNALDRLNMLLEALKPEPPPEKKDEGKSGGGGEGNKGAKPPGDGIQKLAELKLLKLLQQEIQLRTVDLEKAVGAGEANEDQRHQFTQLAEEQGRLAELILKMLQPADKAPEENIENFPEGEEGK